MIRCRRRWRYVDHAPSHVKGVQAREALQTLLVDRIDCTPVLVAGTRGYAFTGDGAKPLEIISGMDVPRSAWGASIASLRVRPTSPADAGPSENFLGAAARLSPIMTP
jgi:hypothetical protein